MVAFIATGKTADDSAFGYAPSCPYMLPSAALSVALRRYLRTKER